MDPGQLCFNEIFVALSLSLKVNGTYEAGGERERERERERKREREMDGPYRAGGQSDRQDMTDYSQVDVLVWL